MKKTTKKNRQKQVVLNEKIESKRMLVSDMGIGFKVLDFKSNDY